MHDALDHAPEAAISPTPVATPPPVHWRLATRIAFRFFATYFTLYIVSTQMIGSMFGLPPLVRVPLIEAMVSWVAVRVWGFSMPLVLFSGSGDKPFDYALAFTLLIVSVVVTVLWSLIDRRRPNYVRLHAWLRLLLRLAVGATMISYGMSKAIPLQMPFPGLTRLLEPYGQFSLMGVLWAQVGASPAFERFTGFVELTAGCLLFIPGLTLLGAVTSLLASTFIFVLNMTYDVPVKLFSLHLVVMSLVLLAPDWSRLVKVFVLNRAADRREEAALAVKPMVRRAAVGVQLALGAWLLFSNFTGRMQALSMYGSAAPKPPLYGIWDITTMTIDGHVRSPLTTDYDRFRRLVISASEAISFQRMDDTFAPYRVKLNSSTRTFTVSRSVLPATPLAGPMKEVGQLTFQEESPDHVTFEGTLEGKKLRLELDRVDHTNFRLLQSRFRWVQDYPFNR
jgi:hypothetical protein